LLIKNIKIYNILNNLWFL